MVALVLGYVHVTAVVALVLVVGGLGWVLALSVLNSLYQLTLPGWVKARGMSFYLIVFQGGNAVGSAVMGVTAERIGLSPTMLVAAAALALGPLAGLHYHFRSIPTEELMPAGDWPQPLLVGDEAPGGPVMVTVDYRPREGLTDDLLAALEKARFSRRRTGRDRLAGLDRRRRSDAGSSSSSSWRRGRSTSVSTSGSRCTTRGGWTPSPRHDRPRPPGDGHPLADAPVGHHRRSRRGPAPPRPDPASDGSGDA